MNMTFWTHLGGQLTQIMDSHARTGLNIDAETRNVFIILHPETQTFFVEKYEGNI